MLYIHQPYFSTCFCIQASWKLVAYKTIDTPVKPFQRGSTGGCAANSEVTATAFTSYIYSVASALCSRRGSAYRITGYSTRTTIQVCCCGRCHIPLTCIKQISDIWPGSYHQLAIF